MCCCHSCLLATCSIIFFIIFIPFFTSLIFSSVNISKPLYTDSNRNIIENCQVINIYLANKTATVKCTDWRWGFFNVLADYNTNIGEKVDVNICHTNKLLFVVLIRTKLYYSIPECAGDYLITYLIITCSTMSISFLISFITCLILWGRYCKHNYALAVYVVNS